MKAFVKAVLGASINPALALSIIVLGATGVAGASLSYAAFTPYAGSVAVAVHKSVVTAEAGLMPDSQQVLGASTSACAGGDTVVQFIYKGSATDFLLTQNAAGQNILYAFPSTAALQSWNCSSVPAGTAAQEGQVQTTSVPATQQVGCNDPLSQINGTCSTSTSSPLALATTPTTARVGQLVYNPGSQTVYLVASNGLYGFPNLATFQSWGFTFPQVVPENSAEQALPYITTVPTAQAGCSNPLSQIAGTCETSASPASNNNSATTVSNTIYFTPETAQDGTVAMVSTTNLFASSGNSVCFSQNSVLYGCVSNLIPLYYPIDNQMQFTVPNSLAAGTYNITIKSTNTSIPTYTGTFYVSSSAAAVTYISGISSASVALGGSDTLTGLFPASGNIVSFYDDQAGINNNKSALGYITLPLASTNNGTSLPFTVPQGLLAGCYPVSVSNSNGRTGDIFLTIGSSAPTGACAQSGSNSPYITSISPLSGAIGSTVTIYGSGFSTNGLEVDFGSPAVPQATTTAFVVSSNSTAYGLQVVIPPSLSAGSMPIIVKNVNGFSNQVNFTVTSGVMTITAPTPASVAPGGTVTVTGNGFTSSNTVYFDNLPINNVNSTDGKTLQFVVPATTPAGQYNFTVTNSNGQQSNQEPMTVAKGTIYITGGINFGWGSGNSSWGALGEISGSGFTPTGNVVHLGSVSVAASLNGTAGLFFTVPNSVPLNTLVPMYVTNSTSAGNNSSNVEDVTFSPCTPVVSSTNGIAPGGSFLPSVQPVVSLGATVTLKGSCFAATGNSVTLTIYTVNGQVTTPATGLISPVTVNNLSSADGVTLQIPTASLASLPWSTMSNGEFGIVATVSNGYENTGYGPAAFYVTKTGSSGAVSAPTITSLTGSNGAAINSGPVGTSLTINGSGFTATGNAILSTNGGFSGCASSSDGKTLTLTIPYDNFGGCCPQNLGCDPAGPTNPGTYSIYIQNTNGTSNSVTFTVTPASSTQLPSIYSFLASPIVNGTSILVYSVSGAASVSINNGVGSQSNLSSGTVSVSPTQTTTYTLTATNGAGTVNSQPVTVTVQPFTSPSASVNITAVNRDDSGTSSTGFYACGTGFSTNFSSDVNASVVWTPPAINGVAQPAQSPIWFIPASASTTPAYAYTLQGYNPPSNPTCVYIPFTTADQAPLTGGWKATFTLYNIVTGSSDSVDMDPLGYHSPPLP